LQLFFGALEVGHAPAFGELGLFFLFSTEIRLFPKKQANLD
jgi:hypothetical protein